MNREVSDEHLERYFSITREAFDVAKAAPVNDENAAKEIFEMVAAYVSDADHFRSEGDITLAFAALNYAHGWLDCGARLEVYSVSDDRLFTVDSD